MWSGDVTRSGKCKQDRLGLESRGRVDQDDSRHDQLMLPRMVQPCPTSQEFPANRSPYLERVYFCGLRAGPPGTPFQQDLPTIWNCKWLASSAAQGLWGFIATIAGSSSDK